MPDGLGDILSRKKGTGIHGDKIVGIKKDSEGNHTRFATARHKSHGGLGSKKQSVGLSKVERKRKTGDTYGGLNAIQRV